MLFSKYYLDCEVMVAEMLVHAAGMGGKRNEYSLGDKGTYCVGDLGFYGHFIKLYLNEM